MRVLFLTHRLPYAPNRGDRVRAYYMLRTLSATMQVDLLSLVHDSQEEAHADDVRSIAASVTTVRVPRLLNLARSLPALGTAQPLTQVLLHSSRIRPLLTDIIRRSPPDVVLAYCSSMARFALEPPLEGRPFVLDMVDVDSAKWAALSEKTRAPKKWVFKREARRLACFEEVATRRAAATLVVNERERTTLARIAPAERIRVLPVGVDVDGLRPAGPPAGEPRVIFCGVMNYAPNEHAIDWFAKDVWPLVRARNQAARLLVVGSDPRPQIRALAAADPSITVTGRVPDVRPYLWESAVSIAPITTSHGVQTKVLEAVAAGLPCVVTSAVSEGLPPELAAACAVADDPERYAAAIIDLLSMTPEERRRIAGGVDTSLLDWQSALADLPRILAAAAARHQ